MSGDPRQARVTITVPPTTLAAIDYIATQLRQSRSGTVTAALEHLLDAYTICPAQPESERDA